MNLQTYLKKTINFAKKNKLLVLGIMLLFIYVYSNNPDLLSGGREASASRGFLVIGGVALGTAASISIITAIIGLLSGIDFGKIIVTVILVNLAGFLLLAGMLGSNLAKFIVIVAVFVIAYKIMFGSASNRDLYKL